RVGKEVHAGNLLRPDRVGGGRIDLASEANESFSVRDAGENRGRLRFDERRERRRHPAAVLDLLGRRVNGGRPDRHGEPAALAVEDRTAAGRNLDLQLLLFLSAGAVLGSLRNLNLGEPRDDNDGPESERQRQPARARGREYRHGRAFARGGSTYWT